MFADNYLSKNNRTPLINSAPNADCGIIVVIPCLNEPGLLQTLQSLKSCRLAKANVEVIVLINHSELASEQIRQQNQTTKLQTEKWILENLDSGISFYVVGPVELRKKWAGAGLARKTGMDEAVLRFNFLKKPDGIIVSLDADTIVEENYLVEIEAYFAKNHDDVGAVIAFEHQKTGLEERHLVGIGLYEKYLRYYKEALQFTGYPYSMFTIGSAFAVKADAYVKRGGMNRRQAGEDFYFLQNLVQLGKVGEIGSTKVWPSARLSNRVPFGTGPIMQKWMDGTEDISKTFNFQAFSDLKAFFDIKDQLFQCDEKQFVKVIAGLPESIHQFILHDNFWCEIEDLNKNCSNIKSFRSRFFQKFNAFKVLKYQNFVHEEFFEKVDLELQCQLLKQMQ